MIAFFAGPVATPTSPLVSMVAMLDTIVPAAAGSVAITMQPTMPMTTPCIHLIPVTGAIHR
jgi:hypothetical protein